MVKKHIIVILLFPLLAYSQSERYPIFDFCKGNQIESIKNCFLTTAKNHFFKEFKTPAIVKDEKFTGTANAIFAVTKEGNFKLIYINTPYPEIKKEVERVFKSFPKVTPAWHSNRPIEMKFNLPITFPIGANNEQLYIKKTSPQKEDLFEIAEKSRIADSSFLAHNSQLNIPFTHQRYVDYEYALHKASGTHTASKPYLYSEINSHFDLAKDKKKFLKPQIRSWFGNKIWNEHLLQIKKKDYWFTIDFLVDTQLGKDNSDLSYTYNNSRILTLNGGLGNSFSYSATIYESQGRFAEYINHFNDNPTQLFAIFNLEKIVPGRGKAKPHKSNSYDYPVAEGYLSYTPTKFMQFQFGQGKNFIGDGYRSFLLSDVTSPSTYLKMKVNFWKFQYTNLWLWGTSLSQRSSVDTKEYARKYIAIHYLSINITKQWNIGLFEAAVSRGDQGFDIGFLNPLIFYRSIEFNRGEDAGNALLGMTSKYKLNENTSVYAQLMVDEFSVGNLNNLGDWRNKFAYQLGIKHFNVFDVDNLFLQAEFNYARPYTFSHQASVLNYGHFSQPLGHLWGANFWEALVIARYKKGRWSGNAKFIFGEKGFDTSDNVSYGGNINQSYFNRFNETDNTLAQGNTASIFMAELQGNYLINPSNNLNLFAGLSYRNITANSSPVLSTGNTTWFSIGIRADLFNWYFDF